MYKIAIKENNVVKERIINDSDTSLDIIVEDKDKDKDIHSFDNMEKFMMANLNKANNLYIDILMKKIKKAKSSVALEEVASDFFAYYNIANNDGIIPGLKEVNYKKANYVRNIFDKRRDYATDKIITDIINCYYFNTLSMFSSSQIKDLVINLENDDIYKLFSLYGRDVDNSKFDKDLNNKIKVCIYHSIREFFIKNQSHLCFDCRNADPVICPKMSDRFYPYCKDESQKRPLSEYDDIIDGVQIFKEKGIKKGFDSYQFDVDYDSYQDYKEDSQPFYVDRFIVSKCKKFR